ncbi:Filament-like plant protein 4 [Striga hermonthica]|uniref:Filament-like plant protein 4 n=1 Tax=Striga hermonthica TaxID=68872 RepID=A0A9N7R974_STRHE|nr:Filament-like plant protein 4 [Striga hermonthica]
MDKRSWPWKKKLSDKQGADKAAAFTSDSVAAASEPDAALTEKEKQEASKKPKYVQISMESYTHLIGLQDQVKSYEEQVQSLEDEVKELNEKLSLANTEMTNKENLVKQHAKVAEEAVSGWEKAEAEAAALKNHLESVTLLKLTAEDRGSHLDGALKECMRQIRNLKEDHEQKLHELILSKQKLFDKMKLDLESRIAGLDRDLLRSAAENAALSRSLQERSNTLVQLSEEKSRAEAEIEMLKRKIESWEKEVSSLKYELHVARKEVEIRNEEKNMSVRSAEVANRQHLEGAKKIAKLEVECQRLRGLVRKKLPGPAALAQMKLEVESLGRRSPVKPPSPNSAHFPEFSIDGSQSYLKENELLTERLLAKEEEMRMLKEALAKRNNELQASRSLYAKLEAQVQASGEQKSERNVDSPNKSENASKSNDLDLMDDFVEMEKLAYLSNAQASNVDLDNNTGKSGPELLNNEALVKLFVELQSKISTVLDSISREKDREKVAEDISRVLQDLHETSRSRDGKSYAEDVETISQELQTAIGQIYNFVTILGKEAKATVPRTILLGELSEKLDTFTAKYSEAIYSDINSNEFVLDISRVLNKASELHFNVLGFRGSEGENGSSDCVDKIVLPENKPILKSLEERYSSNSCARFSDSASDADVPTSESTAAPCKWSMEEFEQLKTDKDNLADELARCMENFESTRSQLLETERVLGEVRSQLTLAEKSNSLAETQLKCMAESYESLEKRTDELKREVSELQGKIESLEGELQKEKKCHQEAVKRCKDLQGQLERIDYSVAADNDDKISQEKELAAAAEKLAECQQTILLLGKQLKALCPQSETLTPPNNARNENIDPSFREEPTVSGTENLEETKLSEPDTSHLHRAGSESPMNPFNSTYTQSNSEANNFLRSPISSKYPKHRPTKSGLFYAPSTLTPEKHSRGFTRFFSTKGKN